MFGVFLFSVGIRTQIHFVFQALSEAKAKRSKLSIFLAEAATPQTLTGQVLVMFLYPPPPP